MVENKLYSIIDEQFISYYGGYAYKIGNDECKFWVWHNKEESQKVCENLNKIIGANEQLKKDLRSKFIPFAEVDGQYATINTEEFNSVLKENVELTQENEQLKRQLKLK